jgi:hypothetical protein
LVCELLTLASALKVRVDCGTLTSFPSISMTTIGPRAASATFPMAPRRAPVLSVTIAPALNAGGAGAVATIGVTACAEAVIDGPSRAAAVSTAVSVAVLSDMMSSLAE